MYLFYFLIFYFFYSNIFNFFFLYLLIFILVYFLNFKNFLNILNYGICIEDRLTILLENIIKIEYNLFIYYFLVLFVTAIYFKQLNMQFVYYFLIIFSYFDCLNTLQQEFLKYQFNVFNLNSKLLNGLFLIHPFCIYIYYSLIFSTFILTLYNIFVIRFYNNNLHKGFYPIPLIVGNFSIQKYKFYIKYYSGIFLVSICGIVAIILGAWWAYQEVNWNGWWSWDLIELVNFILILFTIYLLHKPKYYFYLENIMYSNYYLVITLITFLFISRYNIINSLHSFVVLDNFEQYSFVLYILSCIMLLKYFLIFFKNFYNRGNKTNNISVNKIYLKQVSVINFSLYFILIIYLMRVYLEILLFLFKEESNLEYLYFYKNINMFFFLIILNLYNSFTLFPILSSIILTFFEIWIILIIYKAMYLANIRYFWIHFIFFFFVATITLLNNNLISVFFIKIWDFNLLIFFENYKINLLLVKLKINYYNEICINIYNNLINFYYFDILTNNLLFGTSNKVVIFFLSNFFFYFGTLSVLNYKLFFFYNLIFFEFFTISIILYYLILVAYRFLYLKKKIL